MFKVQNHLPPSSSFKISDASVELIGSIHHFAVSLLEFLRLIFARFWSLIQLPWLFSLICQIAQLDRQRSLKVTKISWQHPKIYDPLSQTHSPTSSDNYFHAMLPLFCHFLKSTEHVRKQWSLPAVTVGRPSGSISWTKRRRKGPIWPGPNNHACPSLKFLFWQIISASIFVFSWYLKEVSRNQFQFLLSPLRKRIESSLIC